jgi:hypothetical protein
MVATNNSINLSSAGIVGYDGAGTFAGTTVTQYAVITGGAATDTLSSVGPLTDGQLVIGSTGVAPAAATLTNGAGISISNGAGTITITNTIAGLSWTDVTGTTQAMAVNKGYTANNAGLVTLTLPATAAYGTIFAVGGVGAGGWQIAQNASQTVYYGDSVTTTGVTGYLASTKAHDVVYLLCITADTDFLVTNSVGNLIPN